MAKKLTPAQIEALYLGYAAEQNGVEWKPNCYHSDIRSNVLKKLMTDGLVLCPNATWTWGKPHTLTDSARELVAGLGFPERYAKEKAESNALTDARNKEQEQYRSALGLNDEWAHWQIGKTTENKKEYWMIRGIYTQIAINYNWREDTSIYCLKNISPIIMTTERELDAFQREFTRMRELFTELQAGMYKIEGDNHD